MTFWEHFFRLLLHRPAPALAALYWHITRRRVRARNRLRVASADLPFAYRLWIAANEPGPGQEGELRSRIRQFDWKPRFCVLLHSAGQISSRALERSRKSIELQIYPASNVIEVTPTSLRDAIAKAEGDFLVPLRIGDALSNTALYRIAEALQLERTAAILYGDQDRLDERERRVSPWFKPRWNEEMFLAQDYLSPAIAIETLLARKVTSGPAVDLNTLVLAAALQAQGAIIHLPHILCHVGTEIPDTTTRLTAVADHVQPNGALCRPGPFGSIKIEWPLPRQLPLVTIIIPTRDKVELLEPCVSSIVRCTDYSEYEILIVDNDSLEQRTKQFLSRVSQEPNVRVLKYPGAYNYSAINNFAVQEAHGKYVCLLNNDTEVLEPEWLSELMRYATRPGIGAVGAKLLYEDGTIQHAGVVVGIGGAAGHAHRYLPAGKPGYFAMPHIAQFVSAVTGACLLVQKEKFNAVGGLDEDHLSVAFNDVDLCLKLEAAGWRNVYVPHAVLVHHESKSRGSDMAPAHIDRYRRELTVLQERWGTKTFADPLHNPNLDRYSETFILRL